MMLTMAQLKERLVLKYSDIEQIDESVVCCTRKDDGRVFAVYYFDIGMELPETSKEIVAYQDRVIGPRYFDGGKSLQWNSYLYFIIDNLVSRD